MTTVTDITLQASTYNKKISTPGIGTTVFTPNVRFPYCMTFHLHSFSEAEQATGILN